MDWMKANIPKEFKEKQLDIIRENITLGESTIHIDPKLPLEEVLDDEIRDAYFQTVIDETTGNIKESAAINSLVSLGILTRLQE